MPEEAANVNITSALPDDIRESVAVADLKNLGTAPDLLMAFALKDHVASSKRTDGILETAMGKVIEDQRTIQAEEAVGIQKVIGANFAEMATQMSTAVATMTQLVNLLAQKQG